ncbi:MAG: metallophosphoesterase, partial [Firmicutes bacterium]|nr:metallophosphoesterase [Bacillota bacterium]
MKFAIVADAHVGFNGSLERLACAVREINSAGVEFVVFLGDLVDARAGSALGPLFREFGTVVRALRSPAKFLPGNHDWEWDAADPALAYCTFTGTRSTYGSFNLAGHHFVLLDTLDGFAENARAGKPGASGSLSPAQLEWLRTDLASLNPQTPVVIFSHHPPFPADEFRLQGFADFLAAIAGYHGIPAPSCRIVAVTSGHRHFRETHVVDGIRFEVVGPLSFGLWDMSEVGYTLVELSGTRVQFTWRPLGPSPPAP